VRIEIGAGCVPLSAALREFGGEAPRTVLMAAGAGDDYEIAFTAPASEMEAILDLARRTITPVAVIGSVLPGSGVAMLDGTGQEIPIGRKGYMHF